ncbi:hypothetical protein [Nocardia sp. NPDC052566]|uniref:hypothetical protein n=1 Tax=Nocardia sp. NPDC052566 TaxID=3364330 RepID=UPI0037CB3418
MNAITLNPQVLGQAENAHRAVLDEILRNPGMTYRQWVGLTLAVTAGDDVPLDELIARLAGALKADIATVRSTLGELADAELIEPIADAAARIRVTALGRTRFGGVRSDIEGAMKRAYADIQAGELAIAGRVLAQVTTQMNAVLAGVRG